MTVLSNQANLPDSSSGRYRSPKGFSTDRLVITVPVGWALNTNNYLTSNQQTQSPVGCHLWSGPVGDAVVKDC